MRCLRIAAPYDQGGPVEEVDRAGWCSRGCRNNLCGQHNALSRRNGAAGCVERNGRPGLRNGQGAVLHANRIVRKIGAHGRWNDAVGSSIGSDCSRGQETFGEGVAVDRASNTSGEGWIGDTVDPHCAVGFNGERGRVDNDRLRDRCCRRVIGIAA